MRSQDPWLSDSLPTTEEPGFVLSSSAVVNECGDLNRAFVVDAFRGSSVLNAIAKRSP